MRYVTVSNVLIVALLAIIVVMGIQRCSDSPENAQLIEPPLAPVVQKVDKAGTAYDEIRGTLYTEVQMKALTDSFRKILNKGKVTQVTTTETRIDTFLKQDTLIVNNETGEIYAADSSPYHKVSYTGNYKLHTGGFQMTFRDDTATYISTIKKRLLRPDLYTTSVYHSNPFFKPSAGNSYTVAPRKVIASVGPTIGYGITTSGKPEAYIGIGLTFNLLGIKTK